MTMKIDSPVINPLFGKANWHFIGVISLQDASHVNITNKERAVIFHAE